MLTATVVFATIVEELVTEEDEAFAENEEPVTEDEGLVPEDEEPVTGEDVPVLGEDEPVVEDNELVAEEPLNVEDGRAVPLEITLALVWLVTPVLEAEEVVVDTDVLTPTQ